ncbi:MAG: exosortase/archaeosortase family protein [Candidatus Saliniplasma sp.]
MKKFDMWRFFAGLIIFFAGLDVTLLLSHMSRLIGVALLLLGILLIISANKELSGNLLEKLPKRFLDFFELPTYEYTQKGILAVLVLLSIYFFINYIILMALVFIAFAFSEFLLWVYSKDGIKKDHISLLIEFQVFAFLTFLVFADFNIFFGYREAPQAFSYAFLLAAWIIEASYLYARTSVKITKEVSKDEVDYLEGEPLSKRFLNVITLNGRLMKFLPVFGLLLILGVIIFNLSLTDGLDLGSHDGISILLGFSMIFYNKIPDKYSTEKEYAFLFLIFLFLILILPLTIIHYIYGGITEQTNSPVVYYLLAKPTAYIVNLFGISARTVDGVMGIMIIMETLVPTNSYTNQIPVSIGMSCTGLYSVTTFISAFIAFISVQFSKLDRKLVLFLGLGIFLSWVANILRMTLIIVAGYLYGVDVLLWTHHNAGIFIFMAWIALFWGLMFKFMDIPIRHP